MACPKHRGAGKLVRMMPGFVVLLVSETVRTWKLCRAAGGFLHKLSGVGWERWRQEMCLR